MYVELHFFDNYLRLDFEIPRAPSKISASLPCQFSLSGQIYLLWAEATLKVLAEVMTQNAMQAKKSRSFTVGVSFRLSSYYSLVPEGKQVSFHALQISQGRQSLGTYTEKRQSMINERLASGF